MNRGTGDPYVADETGLATRVFTESGERFTSARTRACWGARFPGMTDAGAEGEERSAPAGARHELCVRERLKCCVSGGRASVRQDSAERFAGALQTGLCFRRADTLSLDTHECHVIQANEGEHRS